ncbi:uncharacterized protein LOC143832275 isoform X2 [Paroedura picta]|uniref:uncharacterized protein LOC143832275 isoform X2 n=1 Tax=Paroedura picta TaxID=143630 RepID=UPI0040572A74
METPSRPLILTTPPPMLRPNAAMRCLVFNLPTATMGSLAKCPTTAEVNGLANIESIMLPSWGTHPVTGHIADEAVLGIPNPLHCIHRNPVEESEDEETQRDTENDEAFNETMEMENKAFTPKDTEHDEAFNESMEMEDKAFNAQVNSLMSALSRLLAICTSVTPLT